RRAARAAPPFRRRSQGMPIPHLSCVPKGSSVRLPAMPPDRSPAQSRCAADRGNVASPPPGEASRCTPACKRRRGLLSPEWNAEKTRGLDRDRRAAVRQRFWKLREFLDGTEQLAVLLLEEIADQAVRQRAALLRVRLKHLAEAE